MIDLDTIANVVPLRADVLADPGPVPEPTRDDLAAERARLIGYLVRQHVAYRCRKWTPEQRKAAEDTAYAWFCQIAAGDTQDADDLLTYGRGDR